MRVRILVVVLYMMSVLLSEGWQQENVHHVNEGRGTAVV